jgi:hypothetical protein
MNKFYLGTHMVNWLAALPFSLFVARQRLFRYRTLPVALEDWSLDSGGFMQLFNRGNWDDVSVPQYIGEARRFRDNIGKLKCCAPMDWMCEPAVLEKTHKTVVEHQRLTLNNFLELRSRAPDVNWIPVLQGWTHSDYLRHYGDYADEGIDLRNEPIVGIGTVCRRQKTDMPERVIWELADMGVKLHGFGFKTLGLERVGDILASSDSMAWSYDARRAAPLPGCTHLNCANCPLYATMWRDRLLARIANVHPAVRAEKRRQNLSRNGMI